MNEPHLSPAQADRHDAILNAAFRRAHGRSPRDGVELVLWTVDTAVGRAAWEYATKEVTDTGEGDE